jgi:hypothetical protein
VKSLDRPGPGSSSGQADFVTLPRKAAADRGRLRKTVEAEDGGRELLEAVDRALGMAGEGCPEGAVVESVAPGSPAEASSPCPPARSAQTDFLRDKSFSHPYYWAAFQLTGDWK